MQKHCNLFLYFVYFTLTHNIPYPNIPACAFILLLTLYLYIYSDFFLFCFNFNYSVILVILKALCATLDILYEKKNKQTQNGIIGLFFRLLPLSFLFRQNTFFVGVVLGTSANAMCCYMEFSFFSILFSIVFFMALSRSNYITCTCAYSEGYK